MRMSGRNRYPFAATQLKELEHHALIFKSIVSSILIPPDLIFSIKRSFLEEEYSFSSKFFSYQPQHVVGWNCFKGRKMDPKTAKTVRESLWNLLVQQWKTLRQQPKACPKACLSPKMKITAMEPVTLVFSLSSMTASCIPMPQELLALGCNFKNMPLSLVGASQVTFTVDLRAIDDVGLICDLELSSRLRSAAYTAVHRMIGEIHEEVPVLMSGAGHDAMAMSHLTKVGMLFVRCRGGISHSPEEHVLDDDVWAAGIAVLAFLESRM
ncbi:putative Tetratricopeptide repeat-like superfamily protein [Hibiscus syriacus]|uniref:Tetratricopeptide repeat-like superfamily protein n=1 Tax=Hibiscus syriacus TaxID=106335 RepID=A0A6A3AUU9_HIBSY|nr:putative Tetratricopeptide repeat-like superfamily protein [Hibiscus syriacus]